MLKILAPFTLKEEVVPLIEAGAGELYCGYLSPKWEEHYTDLEFERKGGKRSNFSDIKELKKAVDLAHKKGVPVFLALNGLYVREQYSLLRKIIRDLETIDFDAYIVADLGVLLLLREWKTRKKLHLSTGATIFNSESVDFYRKLGGSRIVLDRQVTIDAMGNIVRRNPDMEFEAFILNVLCVYIDGFCTYLHTYGLLGQGRFEMAGGKKVELAAGYDPCACADPCDLKYSCQVLNPVLKKRGGLKKIRPTFFKRAVTSSECGACALFDIAKAGIRSLKIVGRQLNPESRLRDVRFIRQSLDILGTGPGKERRDFIEKVQALYRQTFKVDTPCQGNNCYHPDVILNQQNKGR